MRYVLHLKLAADIFKCASARVSYAYWQLDLRSVSTTRVHGPSSQAELTVSKNAPEFSGRQLGPWTRVVETDLKGVLKNIIRPLSSGFDSTVGG